MPRTFKCCVKTCKEPEAPFHRFPISSFEKNVLTFRIWVHRINDQDLLNMTDEEIYKKMRICNRHFSEHCRMTGSNKLSWGSLPTLHLPGFTDEPTTTNSLVEQLVQWKDSEEVVIYGKYSKSLNNRRVLPEEPVVKVEDDNDVEIIEEAEVKIEMDDDDDDNDENEGTNDNSITSISNGQSTFETSDLESRNSHWMPTIKVLITSEPGDDYLTDVCRICLRALTRNMNKMRYSEVIKGDSGKELNQMLETVLPFLEMNAYAGAYLCTKCLSSLNIAYELKQVERKTDRRLRYFKSNKDFANQPLLILAEGSLPKPATSKKIVARAPEAVEDFRSANKKRKIISDQGNDDAVKTVKVSGRLAKKAEKNRTEAAASSSVDVFENFSVFHDSVEIGGEADIQKFALSKDKLSSDSTLSRPTTSRRKSSPSSNKKSDISCNYCSQAFKGIYHVIEHCKEVHWVSNSPPREILHKQNEAAQPSSSICVMFVCNTCGRQFNNQTLFKQHLITHSNKHVCRYCFINFETKNEMEDHIESIHFDKDVNNCSICNRDLYGTDDYVKHMFRIHNVIFENLKTKVKVNEMIAKNTPPEFDVETVIKNCLPIEID